MIDPLDLTITPIDGPRVEVGPPSIIVPSAEGNLVPLWTTRAELEKAKQLIAEIDAELTAEQEAELASCPCCGK